MASKTKQACIWSCEKLVKGSDFCFLWTFTIGGDFVDYEVVCKAWNYFRLIMAREYGPVKCVRVFEPHPGGHGWHVHFITRERLDIRKVRGCSNKAGFGRIHVKMIPIDAAQYVAKYVVKAVRGSSYKGKRLWACVGFKGCKVKDIICGGAFVDALKARSERMLKQVPKCNHKRARYMAYLITLAEFTCPDSQMLRRVRDGIATVTEYEWHYLEILGYPVEGVA